MCGRFALAHVTGFWSRFAIIDRNAQLEPRFNIAPSQIVPIVVSGSSNKVVMMRWGLVPFWAKDPKIGNRMINARAETVATKPAFRTSFKWKRCLVPATGFYEWKKLDEGKIPYYIHLRDGSFFSLAGLYDGWKTPEGNDLHTFTIITTHANSVMAKIHNRMPVILRQSDEERWLTKESLTVQQAERVFAPYPSKSMETFEVSKEVNSPANEGPGLIKSL